MRRLTSNGLLSGILLFLAAYWSLGWYVPGFLLSVSMSILSVLVGFAILWGHFNGFVGVLFRKDRDPSGSGAHLAAISIPGIALSVIYGGFWTLAYNLAGQPQDWLGTPASNFSRVILVASCIGLYFTPDIRHHKVPISNLIWLAVLFVTASMTAFILGLYVQPGFVVVDSGGGVRPIAYPTCPDDRPVWVASNSMYFHIADESTWAPRVIPRRCYKTPEEAVAAGFEPSPS